MSDQFLVEQHASTLHHYAQSLQTDVTESWVMLTRDGGIVPINNEKILYTSRPRVGLEITTPPALQVQDPFTLKSDTGLVYITNERVIYLPARPTEHFQSFSAPVLNFNDAGTKQASSWFGIGAWCWTAVVRPVAAGGVPSHIPRLDVKLIFKEGGQFDFEAKFNWLKERLNHARELGLVPAENVEPPPPYEEPSASAPTTAAATTAPAPVDAPENDSAQPAQRGPDPDEPPPDYAEAQYQAVATQLDDRMREQAGR